ncbi:MAG: hypothetical protein MMC23_006955 [Stictis urceolatum]|nr:hypothetical protein [Stictis urceolata]
MKLHQLEIEGIDTGIVRSDTFLSALDYGTGLVEFHDQYLRDQPNSIVSEEDGQLQMATFACMRTVLSHLFPKSTRNGPFIFQLTDMHQSNFFVDRNWHITSVIDLEFAAALPRQRELTPYWLSNKVLDELKEDPERFKAVHDEFDTIFREECHLLKLPISRADAMQQAWLTIGFFFQHSLSLEIGCVTLFQ